MNANRSDLLVSLLLGSILPQMRARAAADGFADLDTLLSGVRKRNPKHQQPAEEPPASFAEFQWQTALGQKEWKDAPAEIVSWAGRMVDAGYMNSDSTCDCGFCTWVQERLAKNAAAKVAAEGEADRQAETAARQGSAKGGNADGYQYSIPVRKTVPDILREAAETYEGRNPVYGDAYKHYGAVMMGFFPQGLYINEPEDWNRFGLFSMMVSKMNRIAANLTTGGHRDSSLDLSVYAGMMTELTEEK